MDGISIELTGRELQQILTGAKTRKIYDMGEGLFLLNFWADGEFFLEISLKHLKRIHLTAGKRKNSAEPGAFCMLMRKHLQGLRILRIEPGNFEKKTTLLFTDGSKQLKLAAEFHEKEGNLILLNEENRILGSFRTLSDKRVEPGGILLPPPLPPYKKRPAEIRTAEDLGDAIAGREDFLRELSKRTVGISSHITEKIFTGLSDPEKMTAAWNGFTELLEHPRPVLLDGGGDYWFCPLGGENEAPASSINDMFDLFFSAGSDEDSLSRKKRELEQQLTESLKKEQKKQDAIRSDLEKLQRLEALKKQGDIILANLYMLKGGESVLVTADIYGESAEEIRIELDPALSAPGNAQKYFEKYKKAQRGLPVLEKRLQETEERVLLLEEILAGLSRVCRREDLQEAEDLFAGRRTKNRKQQAALGPRKFIYKNHTILAGKNPQQNDELSLKTANPEDLWFHARGVGGSHVLIKAPKNEKVPQDIIERAAAVAAHFSKAKKSTKAAVSYTRAKYVAKKKGMPAGMVTVSREQTLLVNPLGRDFLDWLEEENKRNGSA